MFDAEDAGFNLFRGRIVTPQGIIDGTVEVEGGRIIAVRAGQRAGRGWIWVPTTLSLASLTCTPIISNVMSFRARV